MFFLSNHDISSFQFLASLTVTDMGAISCQQALNPIRKWFVIPTIFVPQLHEWAYLARQVDIIISEYAAVCDG